MHFSHSTEPLLFYFSTDKNSLKVKDIKPDQQMPASIVIGFDEKKFVTIQLRGHLMLATSDKLAEIKNIHYEKHPQAAQYADDPDTIILIFTPTWGRWSDYKIDPPKILSL